MQRLHDPLMKEPELKKWIRRRLGAPILKIPLTEEHLDDAVREAKRWFAAKKGVERIVQFNLYAGQVEYDVPPDCDAVYDISFQVSPLDISLIFAPNIIADEKIPYNVFAAPSSVGLYSSFVQALQYTEMAKRVLNAEANWIFFQYRKKVLILPNPMGGGVAVMEYKSNVNTIEQLPERDHDLVKRFSLAWARRDLGEIFSRYDAFPTAQGSSRLNGPELKQQAQAEFEKLEQEIFDSAMPMPFVVG
jgi:hypothetical protein